ncbi:MAG: hypothetical protein CFE29_17605 [Bradyrhizobiaceae bacterium PARB1]|nr:MAG: hypothetical protein CFE29_17605 [Bradyrhizobiaceae bacterium PARB1]
MHERGHRWPLAIRSRSKCHRNTFNQSVFFAAATRPSSRLQRLFENIAIEDRKKLTQGQDYSFADMRGGA